MEWSEHSIGRALAQQVFNRKHLVVVPNCTWPGAECDILAVTNNLRIIDVEIKISRSDLKADAHKDKWLAHWDLELDGVWSYATKDKRRRIDWPRNVWKHYYALPRDIWDDSLLDTLGSSASGVLLLWAPQGGDLRIECKRMAKPNRDATQLSAANAVNIARLASLRMWDALERAEAAAKRVPEAAPVVAPSAVDLSTLRATPRTVRKEAA